jgi:hypothetical protein
MKHPAYLLEKHELWQEGVEQAKIHSDALSECIAKTEEYWNSIKDQL